VTLFDFLFLKNEPLLVGNRTGHCEETFGGAEFGGEPG